MIAHPEVLVQLRDELAADAEGFNDRRRQYKIIRKCLDVKVRRSPQAVACRKRYAVELGRPQKLRIVGEVYVQGIQLMRHERETWIQDYAGT